MATLLLSCSCVLPLLVVLTVIVLGDATVVGHHLLGVCREWQRSVISKGVVQCSREQSC